MQKIVNVLAVASSVVSLAFIGSGIYVYVQRDQLIDNIKSQALEAVLGGSGGLGGALGGSSVPSVGGELPLGSNDLSPQTNPAATPQATVPAEAPASPF